MFARITLLLLSLTCSLGSGQLVDQSSLFQGSSLLTPCLILSRTFPGAVVIPGEEGYINAQSKYWSAQQSDPQPACRFMPQNARTLQEALADVILPNNVSIAVVSGGRSSKQCASNIENGITIDLSEMGGAMMVEDGRGVLMGPAARWQDVYYMTESEEVTVPGARAGDVGVGGYLLGGGLSWLSGQYGWSSDSIRELEIITPMAEMLTLNNHSHPELFWAVKGSAGAFGVITRITMTTVPHPGTIYGGLITYDQAHFPRVCEAFETLITKASTDPTTQGYLTFSWCQEKADFIYSAYLVDTKNRASNDIIDRFAAIQHQHSHLHHMTFKESAQEIDEIQSTGMRRSTFTLTSKPTSKAMLSLHQLLREGTKSIKFDSDGAVEVTLQPITVPHLIESHGSMLSSHLSGGPLLVVSVEFRWHEPKKDDYFASVAKHLKGLMETELEKQGVLHPWIYPNYASKEQNPFGGLTDPRTRAMLTRVRRKYDPQGLWKQHVPGIWHF